MKEAPERSRKTTWKEFLIWHWELIVATDFFTVEAWTRRDLHRLIELFFIELSRHSHDDLYGEALQKREFGGALYNKGDWAETARLARQNLALCEQLRAARLRGHREPDPE